MACVDASTSTGFSSLTLATIGRGLKRVAASADPEGAIVDFLSELAQGLGATRVAVCEREGATALAVSYAVDEKGEPAQAQTLVAGSDISWSNLESLLAGKAVLGASAYGPVVALPLEGGRNVGRYLLVYGDLGAKGTELRAGLGVVASMVAMLLHRRDDLERVKAADRFDPVTGLYTLHALEGMMRPLLKRIAQGQADRAWDVIYFNIADFKSFNSRNGFEEGDALLNRMAQSIKEALGTNYATRTGADHFYLAVDAARSEEIVRMVHDAMDNDRKSHAQVHAGIYRLTGQETSLAQVLDRAKIAGDAAQGDFGHYWRRYDAQMEDELSMRAYVVRSVGQAVREGWIEVAFQPVVGTFSGRVESFEALARWEDPTYGRLSPAQFIDTLERGHLTYMIDLEVLKQVCETLALRLEKGDPCVPVSVNLSRNDLELEDIHERIDGILASSGIPHEYIHIEITETALVNSEELVREHVAEFHRRGYEVWLDDFGSGYSSLNTLRGFGFDCAKLDMVFLQDDRPGLERFIGDIVTSCKHMGLKTLAEGVETQEQFDMLRRVGCGKAQGYLFSKPRQIDELVGLLHERGLQAATPTQQHLYDAVSMTDVREGSYPLDGGEDRASLQAPFGLMVDEEGLLRVVFGNAQLMRVARQLGFPGFEDVDAALNGEGFLTDYVRGAIRQVSQVGDVARQPYTRPGVAGSFRLQLIARVGEKSAYLVSVEEKRDEAAQIRSDLSSLSSLFDSIDLICPAEDADRRLSGGLRLDRGETDGMGLAQTLDWYAENVVHPAQVGAFLAFVDPATLEARCAQAPSGILNGFFDIQTGSNLYEYKRVVLARIAGTTNPARFVLGLARDRAGWTRGALQLVGSGRDVASNQGVREETLWKALMEGGTMGVFWKDADRRFLGANRMFLDYYGFKLEDILGKNDEDMGWHPDPEPFKRDELRVIRHGATVRDAAGKCLVRGRVRDIAASKVPIYHGDKIVGLLGYFLDVTDVADRIGASEAEAQHVGRPTYIDPVTGLVNSAGLRRAARQLMASYKVSGKEFGYLCLQLTGMPRFKEAYGLAACNQLYQQVAGRLGVVATSDDVVGRLHDGRFAIIRQGCTLDDLDALAEEAKQAVAQIRRVGDVPHTVYCVTGTALFSSHHDIALMSAAATADMMANLSARGSMLRYTRVDLLREMRVSAPAWTMVRLVDPEARTAKVLDGAGRLKDAPGYCGELFGRTGRCENCVSLRALQTGKVQRKVDWVGDRAFYVVAQRVEVDGALRVLEKIVEVEGVATAPERAIKKLRTRIAELEGENEELRRETLLDPLTGLFHRTGFNEAARSLVKAGRPTLFVDADIDGFRLFNERWGHDVGDALLRSFAYDLKLAFPDGPVARVAGEEFQVAVCPADDVTVARARAFFEGPHTFEHDGELLSYQLSSGWTLGRGRGVADLARQASRAHHYAKIAEDGRFCAYEPYMDDEPTEGLGVRHREA